MKNILLSLLCFVSCIQATATSIDRKFDIFITHLLKNVPLEEIELNILTWFKEHPKLYDYANGKITQENTHLKYLNEHEPLSSEIDTENQCQRLRKKEHDLEKELFTYHINLSKLTYVDRLIGSLLYEIYSDNSPSNDNNILSIGTFTVRCTEILRVLKNMGIKQTLSDQQLDLWAQLATADNRWYDIPSKKPTHKEDPFGAKKEEITILQKLIATFEK